MSKMPNKIQDGETLSPRHARFVDGLVKGLDKGKAAISAGYSPMSANSIASQLLRKVKIIKALERVGLTDISIAKGIKVNVEAGMGVKATADTSLRGLELASRLKGHLDKEEVTPTSLTQTNIYIQELKNMSSSQLLDTIDSLTEEVKKLKA